MKDLGKNTEKNIEEIVRILSGSMSEKDVFYNNLDQVGKHLIKLTRLKENEDRPGHFREEVADLYILSKILMKTERIDPEILRKASEHFLEKIREIYQK